MYLTKTTPLWVINHIVDIIQDTKTAVVKDFVHHKELQQPLFEFIESQRTYTKTINRITVNLIEQSILFINPLLK